MAVWAGTDVKIPTLRTGPIPLPTIGRYQTPSQLILNCRLCFPRRRGLYLAAVQTAQPFVGKKIICVSLLTDINDKAEAYQWAREYLGLVCLTNLPGSD